MINMDKLQELIEWMEVAANIYQYEEPDFHIGIEMCLRKAQELQAEQDGHKWAVVDPAMIFDAKEDAERNCPHVFEVIQIIEL